MPPVRQVLSQSPKEPVLMPKTTHNYQNDSDTSEQSEQITLLNDVEGILEALASELLEVAAGEQLTQGRAILGLYRSAAQPVVGQLGDDLPEAAQRPGLCIFATEDSYTGGETLHRYAAERCEAEIAVLEGLGHWWMCEDPTQAAELLNNWFDSQD